MAGKIALAILLAGAIAATVIAIVAGNDDAAQPRYATVESVKPDLSNADPRLKAIFAQANELLPGGIDAYNKRIESLRGIPVVVNKWGSWCAPCRREFPALQGAAKNTGGEVAFLGANVDDTEKGATEFLRQFPVPYPHYVDDDLKIAAVLKPAQGAPVTGFYDVKGKLVHTHAGPYETAEELEADIRKYAIAE